MINKYIISICITILLLSFINAETLDIVKIDKDGMTLKVNTVEPIKWDVFGDSYTPIYKDESKYIVDSKTGIKTLIPINKITFSVNTFSESKCIEINPYYSTCEIRVWDFSKFEHKNKIDNKTIKEHYPTTPECFFQVFPFIWDINKCKGEVDYYDITYEGLIHDLDPSLILTYGTTSQGFHNNTVASINGISLNGANITGNWKYYVYFNSTETYWNAMFGTGGITTTRNITLATKTANSYNLTDPYLMGLWGFNDDGVVVYNEKGVFNGTKIGGIVDANEGNGTVGKGYYFDGSNDLINISNSNLLTPNGPLTFSAWIKTTDTRAGLLAHTWTGFRLGFGIGNDNTDGRLGFYTASKGTWVEAGSSLADNSWHHVAVTLNATFVSLYTDGNYIGGGAGAYATSLTGPLEFGRYRDDHYFNGSIDEVKIYNRTLSLTEIKDLYNLGSYHINWIGGNDNWTTQALISDGIEQGSFGKGRFYQFKTMFSSDGTNTFYLKNHTVSAGIQWISDNLKPLISLIFPTSLLSSVDNYMTFVYNMTDSTITNSTLFINGIENQTSIPISGVESFFYAKLADGVYNWSILGYDINGNFNQTNTYWFRVDENPFNINGTIVSKNNTLIIHRCGA